MDKRKRIFYISVVIIAFAIVTALIIAGSRDNSNSSDNHQVSMSPKIETSISLPANSPKISPKSQLSSPKPSPMIPIISPIPSILPTPSLQPVKSWHSVITFSGSGTKTTESFIIKGNKWRVNWQTSGEFNFIIYPERTDKKYLNSCSTMANIIGSGSDTSYCYESGEWYFRIIGDSWIISVEDYY